MSGSDENYILLVDDDDGVLNFMATVLRLEGHRVVSAVNGRHALEVASRLDAGALQLLITDIMMPEMDGYELADRLTQSNPDLRVLYVSGFTEKERGARNEEPPGAPMLNKPFSADELRAVVRQTLSK